MSARRFLPAALAACLLLAACEGEPRRAPRSLQTVELAANRVHPDVAADVITAVRIVLPGPDPGTGLAWEIVEANAKVLAQTGPLKAAPGPSTTVDFYALRPGRCVLRFFLVRPGEAVATPVARCEVTVRVEDE
jgi:hypothetical protein